MVLTGFIANAGHAKSPASHTREGQGVSSVLFENVLIFNGTSEKLSAPSNVLVVGNKIQTISTASIPASSTANLTRIKGEGLVLMPGLIDNHTHLFMQL